MCTFRWETLIRTPNGFCVYFAQMSEMCDGDFATVKIYVLFASIGPSCVKRWKRHVEFLHGSQLPGISSQMDLNKVYNQI